MKAVKRYSATFFTFILMPTLVFVLLMVAFNALDIVRIERVLEVQPEHGNYVVSYNNIVSCLNPLKDKYEEIIVNTPELMKDRSFIKKENERIEEFGFSIDTVKADSVLSRNDNNIYRIINNEYDGEVMLVTLNYDKAVKYVGDKLTQNFILALIIDVILCVVFMIYMCKNVFTPIMMLKDVTEQMKEGDLNVPIDYSEAGEIGKLCRNFDDMRKRLRDNAEEAIVSERESRELISNISHDLKTPITAIKGYVEGLLDGVVDNNPQKKEKYLRTIYNKANDMDKLINELSLYSKIGSNRVTYNFRPINAKEYFNDCNQEVKTELDAKGIQFNVYDNLDDDVYIMADTEYLKRVINNIISNSVKNMPLSDGRIEIKLEDEGQYIRVDMSDNGKGISTKDLPHIFDRFYRGDASRNTAVGGSGIGLSIVKKVIEEHGGKIWVNSKEGVGTTMSFVLKKAERNVEKHE